MGYIHALDDMNVFLNRYHFSKLTLLKGIHISDDLQKQNKFDTKLISITVMEEYKILKNEN